MTRRTVINAVKGYQLMLNLEARPIRTFDDHFGPILSLCEPIAGYTTIHRGGKHRDWKKADVDVIQITNKRLWSQTIHDTNIVNSQRKNGWVVPINYQRQFGGPLERPPLGTVLRFYLTENSRVIGKKVRHLLERLLRLGHRSDAT